MFRFKQSVFSTDMFVRDKAWDVLGDLFSNVFIGICVAVGIASMMVAVAMMWFAWFERAVQ